MTAVIAFCTSLYAQTHTKGAVLSYEQCKQMLNTQYDASHYVYHARYGRSANAPYEGVKGFLAFEDEYMENAADLAEASELANLLKSHSIPITILNACQSGKQVGDQPGQSPGAGGCATGARHGLFYYCQCR